MSNSPGVACGNSGNPDVTYVQLPGSTPTAASFEFRDEGHTLGNALRYIIMKKWVASLLTNDHPAETDICKAPTSSSVPTPSPTLQRPR